MNSKYATVGNRAPSKPKAMWGVTKRSLRFADFKMAFGLGIAALILAVISNAASGEFADAMVFLAWTSGIIGALAAMSAMSNPTREMRSEMRERRLAWEQNELIPYLETKYNVEFRRFANQSIITGMTYKHAYLKDEARTALIKIIGVIPINGGFDEYEYEYKIVGDIEMEEIVHQPETFKRRSLPVRGK